ncbi:hypothetical protein Btru_037522 [Bulinus truncatus]|nr:hypothetical protein Btru_037522 [Bulinus truncatus]
MTVISSFLPEVLTRHTSSQLGSDVGQVQKGQCPEHIELEDLVSTMAKRRSPADDSLTYTAYAQSNAGTTEYPNTMDNSFIKESTMVKELYPTVAASSTHTASPQSNVVTNEYLEPANYKISEATRVKQVYSTVARSGTNTCSLQNNTSAEDDSDYTDVADPVDSASTRY